MPTQENHCWRVYEYRPPILPQFPCKYNQEGPRREHNPAPAAREHGRATGALDMELQADLEK